MSEVIKIGFIDYFLDEWHANNYPAWIREASGGRMAVTYAYGHINGPNGKRTTDQWCADLGVERCMTIDELVEKSDYLIVLSPDNPEMHWELCQKPLRSGKRTYVDKTFAPTAQIARDLFALAEESGTPMYSSSALRYAQELDALMGKDANFVCSCGPGTRDNYLVHQFEPALMLLKALPEKILYNPAQGVDSYTITLQGGKAASISLLGGGNFAITARFSDGSVAGYPNATGTWDRFMKNLIGFFETGEGAVDKAETIAIMALIEAAHKAEEVPGQWVAVDA